MGRRVGEIQTFTSMEEAKAKKPPDTPKSWKLFQVSDIGGNHYFVWTYQSEWALYRVAKKHGYSVCEPEKVLSKEQVASLVTFLSKEDQRELLRTLRSRLQPHN